MLDRENRIDDRYLMTFAVLYMVILVLKLILWKKDKLRAVDFLLIFLLAFYGTAVGHYTLLDRVSTGQQRAELDLFWSYRTAHLQGNRVLWAEIVNNVLLFVPFGILFPWVFSRTHHWWNVILPGFLISCGIELTQLAGCLGLFEYDDIFNNTLGAVLGYSVFRFCECIFRKKKSKWNLLWIAPVLLTGIAGYLYFSQQYH